MLPSDSTELRCTPGSCPELQALGARQHCKHADLESEQIAEMNPVVHNVRPIPQGGGTIEGCRSTALTWAGVLPPESASGTNTFSGFPIHGDSRESPGCASEACVMMPRRVREQLWNSGDTELEGVAEFQTQEP